MPQLDVAPIVEIARRTGQDDGRRRWEVEVVSAGEAYEERDAAANEAVEERKERQQLSKRERQRMAVLAALANYPNGETPRVIRELAGVGHKIVCEIFAELVDEGIVEPCLVQKNTRRESGFRLVEKSGGLNAAGPPVHQARCWWWSRLYI